VYFELGRFQELRGPRRRSGIAHLQVFNHAEGMDVFRNAIQEEIKSRLRSGNACYYSVQNLFSSRLLSKNLKIKIYI